MSTTTLPDGSQIITTVTPNGQTVQVIPGPGTPPANADTIQQNILSRQQTIQAWIAAHPSGATLNAAQTLVLVQMLNGLCKLLLQQFADTSGT